MISRAHSTIVGLRWAFVAAMSVFAALYAQQPLLLLAAILPAVFAFRELRDAWSGREEEAANIKELDERIQLLSKED